MSGGSSDTATAVHTGMLPAGTRLAGRYVLREIVGAGGMGVVYRAFDEHLGVDIALKTLRSAGPPDEAALKRFRAEILHGRQVSHSNVVRIHDLGRDGDVIFLTMDYQPGRTLKERLEDGPLPVDQAVAMARQLCDALSAAHARGVVHRDLKPGNVLLDDTGRALIMDFGVAWSTQAQGLTLAGEVVGTPAYLAPEQVKGEAVDGRADLYALGLMLCQMLTGRLPAAEGTLDETLARRAAGQLIDPAKLGADIPAWLQRVLRRALAPKPGDRYADADELKQALGQAGVPGPHRVQGKKLVAALGLTTLVIVGATWLWLRQVPDAPATAATDTSRVAVLPAVNATGRDTLEWAERALSEAVASALAENPGLQVTDPLRVFRLLEDLRLDPDTLRQPDHRRIAELVDADWLVTGRMALAEGGLRYDFALLDADAREVSRIALQSPELEPLTVVAPLTEQLQAALEAAPVPVSAPVASQSDAALAAYDAGLALLARGDSVEAMAHFQTAVTEDPSFGMAWLRLADVSESAGHRAQAVDAASQAVARLVDVDDRLALQARARQAVLSGNPEQAADLLEALLARFPYDVEARIALAQTLAETGDLDKARQHLEIVVAEDAQHPHAWYLLGRFAIMAGDARRAAEDYLVRALVVENRLASTQSRGDVLNALGVAHDRLGDFTQAEDYYHQAAELRERAGDQRGLAASKANLAHLAMLKGDFAQASESLQQAMAARAAIGDDAGVAELENQLGWLDEEQGRYREALDHYRQALRRFEALGRERAQAEASNNAAFAYLMLGQYDSAAAFNRTALEIFKRHDDTPGGLMALEIRGQLQIAQGEYSTATETFLHALELSRELASEISEAVAQAGLSLIAFRQGRFLAARDGFGTALAAVSKLEDIRGMTEYGLRLAEVALSAGALSEADEYLSGLSPQLESAGTLQVAEYHRLAGLLAARTGTGDAHGHLEAAQTIAEQSDSEPARLRLALARLSIGLDGDPSEFVARAARLGDAELHLSALLQQARIQLQSGQAAAALETARAALRPPVHRADWGENWRLYRVAWLATEAQQPGSGGDFLNRARVALSAMLAAMPRDWRIGYSEGLETELIDADA